MKPSTRITITAVVAAAIVLVGGYMMILNRAFENMCGNEILAESISPDRTKKLVVFQRSCGATTSFSTQASLLSPDVKLADEIGNVFIADTDHGIAPSGAGGGPELRFQWAGPKDLLLQHHVTARVFKAERHLKDTDVKYETFR